MKIKELSESKKDFVLLGLIIAFYFINNYVWLRLSLPFPSYYYYAFDFRHVIDFYEAMIEFDLRGIIYVFVHWHDAFMHPFTAALIAVLFGKSLLLINLLNNMPYFIIAIVSIYLLGKRFVDTQTGLLAALIFSFYPAVFGTSRMFVIEFAVMGIVPLAILCLFQTNTFTNRKYSLLCGLAFGWGMMLKYSFIVFIIGPLFYILANSMIFPLKNYKRDKINYKRVFLNVGIFIVVCIAVMSVKYFNLRNLKGYLLRIFFQPLTNPQIYTWGVIEYQLSLFFFLLFAVAIIFFLVKTNKETKLVLLSWILIPWTVLIIMPHVKMTHYIIPYLPAIALITAIGLMKLLSYKKNIIAVLASLIVIIGLLQYYDFSFGLGLNLDKYKFKVLRKGIHNYVLDEGICHCPKQYDGYNKIIDSIAKRTGKASAKVMFIPDEFFYTNGNNWNIMPWFEILPFDVHVCEQLPLFLIDILKVINEADFLVYSGRVSLKDDYSYIDRIMEKCRANKFESFYQHPNLTDDDFLDSEPKLRMQFKESLNNFKLAGVILEREDGVKIFLYYR